MVKMGNGLSAVLRTAVVWSSLALLAALAIPTGILLAVMVGLHSLSDLIVDRLGGR